LDRTRPSIEEEAQQQVLSQFEDIAIDDSEVPHGDLFDEMANEACIDFTNFSKAKVIDLWREVERHIILEKRRGPKPKFSGVDSCGDLGLL
jgi:hypothetical protein